MKFRSVLLFLILILLILMPACKKKGHAVLSISIGNTSVEYTFWSISYDVILTETAGYNCNIILDELSIIDGVGNVIYSYSYPVSISLSANSSDTRSHSGLLIGPYALSLYTKPVKLRHTFTYTDSGSGDTYNASGEIVVHSE